MERETFSQHIWRNLILISKSYYHEDLVKLQKEYMKNMDRKPATIKAYNEINVKRRNAVRMELLHYIRVMDELKNDEMFNNLQRLAAQKNEVNWINGLKL